MHAVYPLVLAALLFAVGVYGVLARRNAITILMAVELLLNAVNLNLVTFSAVLRDDLRIGQVLTLFVITLAAAETGVGLAIVLMIFRQRGDAAIDRQRALGDRIVDASAPAIPSDRTPVDPLPADALSADGEAR
jgi:NADH-quinone oxidoreductase subunit K